MSEAPEVVLVNADLEPVTDLSMHVVELHFNYAFRFPWPQPQPDPGPAVTRRCRIGLNDGDPLEIDMFDAGETVRVVTVIDGVRCYWRIRGTTYVLNTVTQLDLDELLPRPGQGRPPHRIGEDPTPA